ncbi:MAG: signal peptide peptidase SppA [Candidatus Eremiobacteraeota bacterium]|nr:signal peptide peptidase SppA [Candidatus Eremiobacteraeota bacterium]
MDDFAKEENISMPDTPSPRPAAPPPQKRGVSFWILALLSVVLILSVIANLVLMVLLGVCAGMAGGITTDEDKPGYNESFVMGDDQSKNKVLEIAINGVIFEDEESFRSRDNIVVRVRSELKAAKKDKEIKALLVTVDSPGGGITASDVLWSEIKNYREKEKIPVIAYCKDVTASGGYYVASMADYIMAHETSLVGNIGVIAEFINVKGLCQKIGIDMNVIKSETFEGKESVKDIGNPFREMKPAERKLLQNIINEMWDNFVDVVAEGRKGKLTRKDVEKLADGTIYSGKGALEKKLIDGLGYKEDAFEKAKELAKLKDAKLVKYKSRLSPLQELLFSRMNEPASLRLVPDLKETLRGQSPQLLYLWTME